MEAAPERPPGGGPHPGRHAGGNRPDRSTASRPGRFGPHGRRPGSDGSVWVHAQQAGALGRLRSGHRPQTQIPLGAASSPHGVIVGPDGRPLGNRLRAQRILRIDPAAGEVKRFPLPPERAGASPNTAPSTGAGSSGSLDRPGCMGGSTRPVAR